MSKYQVYMEVYTITEWKNGCVYKTKKTGEAWVDMDIMPIGNIQFVTPSRPTKWPRLVSDTTPSMVFVE